MSPLVSVLRLCLVQAASMYSVIKNIDSLSRWTFKVTFSFFYLVRVLQLRERKIHINILCTGIIRSGFLVVMHIS